MKKKIRKALILFVACIVLFATLDFIFRELRPVTYYLGQGVVFTALVIVLDRRAAVGHSTKAACFKCEITH
jgi:hypothetical protein